MSCTDILQLNGTAMFKKLREGLPSIEKMQTQNVVDVVDDTLFVWNKGEESLLVTNWRSAYIDGIDKIQHQTLTPSSSLNFEVELVSVSKGSSLVALAGARGIAVLELPAKFGKNNQFLDGASKIMCRTSSLCSRFFHNNPHLEVRQVRWHPASPTDSHLLVLLSDNTIRVYDSSELLYVWQVGPIPMKAASTLMALGETVVDFDFAPEIEYKYEEENEDITNLSQAMEKTSLSSLSLSESQRVQDSTSKDNNKSTRKYCKIEWPVVLLRENGNIYIMLTNFENRKHRLQGPLVIMPPAIDNYGNESCSLLVLPSLPPTVIISESNGRLHHCLLLDLEEAENSFNEVDETLSMEPVQWMLHLFETVELELGLPKILHTKKMSINCPVHLKRDIVNDTRYFAYHDTGFHAVTLHFLADLEHFVESDINTDLTPYSAPSSAEYILCTKIDSQERKTNAVVGFAAHEMPAGLIAFLASGEAISLKLILNTKLLVDTTVLKDKDVSSQNTNQQKAFEENEALSFVEDIQNILKRDISQPIISIDRSTKLTKSECLEFLKQSIDVLKVQYTNKHERVADEFFKKITHMQVRENQQKCEIEFLEKQIQQIRDNAHKIAEKFEEINERQEEFTKRCFNLIRESKTRIPADSMTEVDFVKQAEKLNFTVKKMQSSLKTCRETLNRQKYHVSKSNASDSKKSFELPEKHQTTILDILTALGSEIQEEIADTKLLNKLLTEN